MDDYILMPLMGLWHPGWEDYPYKKVRIPRDREEQAQNNHDQSLDELRIRGGLDPAETVAILERKSWREVMDMTPDETIDILRDYAE